MNADTVKEFLTGHRELEKEIVSQTERLNRMELRIIKAGIPDDATEADGSWNAETLRLKRELELDIREKIARHRKGRQYIEDILSRITDAEETALIRARYFDGLSWWEVTDLLFGAKKDYQQKEDVYLRRVHTISKTALENMAKYMEATPLPADFEEAKE